MKGQAKFMHSLQIIEYVKKRDFILEANIILKCHFYLKEICQSLRTANNEHQRTTGNASELMKQGKWLNVS